MLKCVCVSEVQRQAQHSPFSENLSSKTKGITCLCILLLHKKSAEDKRNKQMYYDNHLR